MNKIQKKIPPTLTGFSIDSDKLLASSFCLLSSEELLFLFLALFVFLEQTLLHVGGNLGVFGELHGEGATA